MSGRGVALTISFRHSGIERMAQVLRREGAFQALYVPHDSTRAYRTVRRVFGPGSRLAQVVSKRAYDPPGTSIALRAALFAGVANRAGLHRFVLSGGQRAAMAPAVAHRLERRPPDAFVTLHCGSAEPFEVAARLGVSSVLLVNTLPWAVNAALERMADFAGLSSAAAAEARSQGAGADDVEVLLRELELASVVLAQSTHARDILVAGGAAPEKIEQLPNAVDTARFAPVERPRGPRALDVLAVGWVSYRKGLVYLDRAVGMAGASVRRCTVVGGDWGRTTELRKLLSNLELPGEVFPSAMPERYATADVFVLPSVAESMARSVLEAMAAGLPVIITPECGFGGIVDDGVEGFVVPSHDALAIAQRLRQLSEDGELRLRMGRAARARPEEYGWPRFEETFLEILRRRVPGAFTSIVEGRSRGVRAPV